jgi:hypothetical protein
VRVSKSSWCCVLLMSVFVAWPSCAIAQAQDPTDAITTYMAQDRLPSLSVAVGRPGEIAYGLGWRLSDEPGEVFHGGSSVGGSAYLYVRVETGTIVAIATNVDRWTKPRHELARALADWAESR